MTYSPSPSAFGALSVELIRSKLSEEQWAKLWQHAIALACLDGNAYLDVIERYVPDAYDNLWSNSALDMLGLPNLHPYDATDAAYASMSPSHPQYEEMEAARRNDILDRFEVDPRGKPENVEAIITKASDILGSREKAEDWIDQYSATLADYPRRMAATANGTDEVLRHLGRISHHGHDA